MCMHPCPNTCMHPYSACTHTQIHTRMYTNSNIHIFVHKLKHTLAWKHAPVPMHVPIPAHMHVQMAKHSHIHAPPYTCLCPHKNKHVHTHTYTHTHACIIMLHTWSNPIFLLQLCFKLIVDLKRVGLHGVHQTDNVGNGQNDGTGVDQWRHLFIVQGPVSIWAKLYRKSEHTARLDVNMLLKLLVSLIHENRTEKKRRKPPQKQSNNRREKKEKTACEKERERRFGHLSTVPWTSWKEIFTLTYIIFSITVFSKIHQ